MDILFEHDCTYMYWALLSFVYISYVNIYITKCIKYIPLLLLLLLLFLLVFLLLKLIHTVINRIWDPFMKSYHILYGHDTF